MASTHKSLRSSTANKRPTTAIADGQIALNTNATSPGLFFKDSTGATIIKIGPVHVGTTAPNATPGSGGSTGNSTGEVWLDTSLTPLGVKIWDGSAWQNATPSGSTTVQGLLELATNAETQTGSDTARAVTPAGLQSKLSDSTSTTSSTTIASSTAVKAAYDLAAAAVPLTGGTVTGNLEIGTTGSLSFEGTTANGFETTIAVTDPTADRTITLPDTTGTVVTTGDTGTVTSTMLLDGTVVDADISATAEIAVSKLADGAARQLLQTDAAGTGVEWTSNVDIPGTLDVTGAAVFDSNLTIANGGLIKADFTNATVLNRTYFQTSAANQTTVVAAIPSGAGTTSAFYAFNDSDPTNAAYGGVFTDATRVVINSGVTGTGTQLPMVFNTNNQEQARFTTTDRYFRMASGTGGIQFNGDTAATNALDDYEEGTFVPIVFGMTTAGAGTYTVRTGAYTKIGNRVMFQLRITWTAHTGTGIMRIGDLPFAASGALAIAPVTVRHNNIALPASTVMQAYLITSTDTIALDAIPAGGGVATGVSMDPVGDLIVGGQYLV